VRNRLLLLVPALVIAGAAAAQTADVEVSAAWARATPGKTETASAYLTLKSAAGDRLVALSTPVADKAGVHEMTMEGSVMRMRPVPALEVPAGKPVVLKPNGLHIMLSGLHQKIEAGQSFPLTLTFEKAGEREVSVLVEKAGAMGPAGHMGH